MFSVPINLPKSALIKMCRYGYTKKKRGDSYLLLAPQLEAFALPDNVERATRNPRRCVYTISPTLTGATTHADAMRPRVRPKRHRGCR